MSIRVSYINNSTVFNEMNAMRGDTTRILIQKTIPPGSMIRAHLRETPNSETYRILDTDGQYVVITPEVSEFLEGIYVFDVEVTTEGEVTTYQQTTVNFKADVTRTNGTEEPTGISDFERKKIIAESFWVRGLDDSLEEIPLTGMNQALFEATAQAEAAAISASDASGYATAAEGYSLSAKDSETASEQFKTAAEEAAVTASDKADEISGIDLLVSGYRDETLGFRNEAEQFKTDAQTAYSDTASLKSAVDQAKSDTAGYRDEASSSKTDAQTAQGLAEGARDDAVLAKNAAEGFADDAAADLLLTGEDRTQTGLDAIATAADRVATGLDKAATAQDKIATNADVVLTHADVVTTGQDRAAMSVSLNTLEIPYAFIADDTFLITGDGQITIHVTENLAGKYLVKANAAVSTPSSAGIPTFNLRNVTQGNVDILSTPITVPVNQYDSFSATQSAINPVYKLLTLGDRIAVDCDIAGTGTKGCCLILKVSNV